MVEPERHYVECRCLLLELAATLDRYDQALSAFHGNQAGDKDRLLLQQAIQVLAVPSAQPDRAESILRLLSDPIS
jgi:hypothetical protein